MWVSVRRSARFSSCFLNSYRAQFEVEYGKEAKYFHSKRVVGGTVKFHGRPPAFLPADALGLTLHWLLSPCQEKYLCLLFGAVPAVLNRAKNDGLNALYLTLQKNHYAGIRWPNAVQVVVGCRMPLSSTGCTHACILAHARVPTGPDAPVCRREP